MFQVSIMPILGIIVLRLICIKCQVLNVICLHDICHFVVIKTMTKNQYIRAISAHDCTKLQLRLTPDQARIVKIAAAMAGLSAPRFVETRLEQFINENHGIIEPQKAS